MIRVLVVDDQELVRAGLRGILRTEFGFDVPPVGRSWQRLAYPVRRTGTNEQTTIVDTVCAEKQGAAVRIGEPAREHGVGDADIWHAVRTAIRKIDMDDDLTMLIGPARDGAPLEIGVLDLNGEDPVVIHAMRLRPKFYPLIRQG